MGKGKRRRSVSDETFAGSGETNVATTSAAK